MSYLKTVSPEDATGQVAEVYKPVMEMVGMVPAPLQLMSASPNLLVIQKQIIDYYGAHPTLSQGLLALIRLLVSEELQYEYCISFNSNILKMVGIASDDQLAAVMADPRQAPLEEKEKALLALVLKVCANPEEVQESEIQDLRDLGWEDPDIMDAVSHGLMMVQGGILAKAVGLPTGAAC
jgi:uncharacterized peroxidase-related enzyme